MRLSSVTLLAFAALSVYFPLTAPLYGGEADLWVTEVALTNEANQLRVELTNTGTTPVTITPSHQWCIGRGYSSVVSANETFAPGQSRLYTVGGSTTDTDVWLYRNSNFGSSASIISGVQFGTGNFVGRVTEAVNAGIWNNTVAFAMPPTAALSLQLTGPNPFNVTHWSLGAPTLGVFTPEKFLITSVRPEGAGLRIIWQGSEGNFQVETSPNMQPDTWLPVGDLTAGRTALIPRNGDRRFIRVRSLGNPS